MSTRIIQSDGRGGGLIRESQAGDRPHTIGCAWCGQQRRVLYRYYREGRPVLSGLTGEGKPFCSLQCFRSYQ